MKADEIASVETDSQNPPNFSLVQGGPLYQLLRRSKLSDDALSLQRRRIIVITLLCWLPVFLFAALEGSLLGGTVTVPFLLDWDYHIRFLVSVPLLIMAELLVHRRMLPLTKQFHLRHLIPDSAVEQFNAAITSALRLRNSAPAELLLILLVYIIGILYVWPRYIALDTATWYATLTATGSSLSLAGKWFVYVSLPIFQFLLIRWYFRLFIWTRFLWQVSRIKLNIIPTHPDGVGGLGFLGAVVITFAPLLMAHGAQVAGLIANRIFYRSATAHEFVLEIAFLIGFLMCLLFVPLLVFSPQLERAKRKGISEYGALASRYVEEFDEKWLRSSVPPQEPLVGSADIQSLADLGNSFGIVRSMSIVPFTKGLLLQLAFFTVVPLAPLALTMMPMEELLKKLLGLLL
jgi:hypothetical protein